MSTELDKARQHIRYNLTEQTCETIETLARLIVREEFARSSAGGGYRCPVCGTSDPDAYTRCNHGGCPDGRDPRSTSPQPAPERGEPLPEVGTRRFCPEDDCFNRVCLELSSNKCFIHTSGDEAWKHRVINERNADREALRAAHAGIAELKKERDHFVARWKHVLEIGTIVVEKKEAAEAEATRLRTAVESAIVALDGDEYVPNPTGDMLRARRILTAALTSPETRKESDPYKPVRNREDIAQPPRSGDISVAAPSFRELADMIEGAMSDPERGEYHRGWNDASGMVLGYMRGRGFISTLREPTDG